MKAMADDTRQRILSLLVGEREMSVSELNERLALSQPTISHHLALLRRANLVIALDERLHGGRRHSLQEGIHPAHGVEIVVDFLRRFFCGRAAAKLQRPDRGLDGIGR